MPRQSAVNVRSDRIAAVIREIATSGLQIQTLELAPAGRVLFTFYRHRTVESHLEEGEVAMQARHARKRAERSRQKV